MPKRFIGEETRWSRTLDQLSDGAFRLAMHLITICDDYGRFMAAPDILLAHCFPLKVRTLKLSQISMRYKELETAGLVQTYEVEGKMYGYFPTFNLPKHQGPPRAKKAKFPGPQDSKNTSVANKAVNICKQTLTDALVSASVSVSVSAPEFESASEKEPPSPLQGVCVSKNSASSENSVFAMAEFGPDELAALWNTEAPKMGLSCMLTLTKKRRSKMKSRLRSYPKEEFWNNLIQMAIRNSPFLLGDNKSGWKVSLDWITANDENPLKVAEGRYANGKESPGQKTKRNLDQIFGAEEVAEDTVDPF